MTLYEKLNSPFVYAVCGGIVFFVLIVCVVFMVRAWRAGVALGMDKDRMKKAVTASASFSVLPSLGILLGVIALSGSLGVPWSWLRLSVIGALHYETQVAAAAAEQIGVGLSSESMTAPAFSTIALLMCVCIMWGMILATLIGKRYLERVIGRGGADQKNHAGGFADHAMTAMFVGMVSAYLGSYIGSFVSGSGHFAFAGSWTPLGTAAASAAAMALFTWLAEKKNQNWLRGFSIAASMLVGMATAMLIGR